MAHPLAPDLPATLAQPLPALAQLGVHPGLLDASARASLQEQGFLLLPGHLPEATLARLRTAHDRAMAEKYPCEDPSPAHGTADWWFHEPGTRRLTDLWDADPVFTEIAADPMVLAATHELIEAPFLVDSINAREACPGHGAQPLHLDRERLPDGSIASVNTAWLLDPWTPLTGGTQVVPGSHRWDAAAYPADRQGCHPAQVGVEAPAGSVLIFATSLWHRGGMNRSGQRRRLVHVAFSRRDQDLGWRAPRLRLRLATWERLSEAERWLFGV